MKLRCPKCDSTNYMSFRIEVDDDWVTVRYECLDCGAVFIAEYKLDSITQMEV